MLIAPWSGMGALTRSPIGVIRSSPETRKIIIDSIREVYRVARANKVEIGEKTIDDTIDFIDQLPPEGTASMQRDILWKDDLRNCMSSAAQLSGKVKPVVFGPRQTD